MAAEKLITDHLDIWTAAIKRKSAAGRGSFSKRELYGVKKLRELILELAMRGLLVPQDPNDEPASELLKKVAAEKAKQVKEGKIRKDTPLLPLGEDEKPFAIPASWFFIKLGEITNIIGGYAFKSSSYSEEGMRVIRISDFDENGIKSETIVRHEYAEKLSQFRLSENCILMAMTGGTVGKSLLVKKLHEPMLVNQRVASINVISPVISDYISILLQTKLVQDVISKAKNSTNDNISMGDITGFTVPLAPLAEQHRIVTKVNELMRLCDDLEQQTYTSLSAHETLVEILLKALTSAADHAQFASSWGRIVEHFDTLFTTEESIDQLKQTILQLAMMGKLVPQDKKDEPTNELLKKIAGEKAKLAKEGKIKKEKPLAPIGEKEKPFVVPEGWLWVRLGQLGICSTGKTPSTKEPSFFDGNIPFIGPGQISPQGELLDSDKFVSEEGLCESTEALPDDVLMVCIGGSIGKAAIADKRLAFNQQINAIRPISVSSKYLFFAMSTDNFLESVIRQSSGSATPIINRSKWEELLVPVCSEDEQHRIVAKVDELMMLCDQLKNLLIAAKSTQIDMADSIKMTGANP